MNTATSLFLFVTLIFSGVVLAKEETIATISNDENNDVYTLVADTDNETNSIKTFYKDDYLNGLKTGRELLSSDDLVKSGLLLQTGENTVVNLKSENFNSEQGGAMTIETSKKDYELELATSSEGWQLFNEGRVVTKLRMIMKKKFFFGGSVVKNIEMN